MRLDHLLSKEQLGGNRVFAVLARSDRTCLLAAHGWNIDIGARLNGFDLVRPLRWVGTGGAGRSGTCTLLGPEGPGACPSRSRGGCVWTLQAFIEAGTWCRRVWGFWPSVENYIVDASILEAAFGLFHNR